MLCVREKEGGREKLDLVVCMQNVLLLKVPYGIKVYVVLKFALCLIFKLYGSFYSRSECVTNFIAYMPIKNLKFFRGYTEVHCFGQTQFISKLIELYIYIKRHFFMNTELKFNQVTFQSMTKAMHFGIISVIEEY